MDDVVGLLHPGEMGAAIGAVLRQRGSHVLWSSSGRSEATAARAKAAGLTDVGSIGELAQRAEVILSVCPPHAARDVASGVGGTSAALTDGFGATASAVTVGFGGTSSAVTGRFG